MIEPLWLAHKAKLQGASVERRPAAVRVGSGQHE